MILKLAEQDLVDARDLFALARHVLVVNLANPAYVSTNDNSWLSLSEVPPEILAVEGFQTLSFEVLDLWFKMIIIVHCQFF